MFVEMPKRKSINNECPSATNLRRSPRFPNNNNVNSIEDPKTPQTRSSRARINPPITPSSGSKGPLTPNINLRRSERLIGRVEDFSYVELSSGSNVKKRVTRSSVREMIDIVDGKLEKRETSSFRRGAVKSIEVLDEKETCSFRKGKAVKNIQKNGCGKCDGIDECVSEDFVDRGVSSSVAVVEDNGVGDGETNDVGQQIVAVERKGNAVEKVHEVVHGWSKDQELALDRAYFATKPTPHFWKKVARLVPGKSAQDCFNKVHSNHLTPPPAQPRSRAKKLSSPTSSLSASKLLNSSGPVAKKSTYRKKSRHLVQKTVRHLLQKQCQVDQNSEEDLFSILEIRMSPSAQSIQQGLITTTPEKNQEKFDILRRCRERSSSAKKKSLSRFSGSIGTTLESPPVLKQVKSKGLHEKYVDLLHCREAKRKAASAREAKLQKGAKEERCIQKMDAIKAAKNALVFDASDAIKKFQHLQANALMSSFSDDDDDDVADCNEDEGDDVY